MWSGPLFNSSPEASKDERYGFDYMDTSSIEPIVRACLEATLWAKKCPFFADMALLFSSVPPGMHFKKRLVSSKN